MPLSRRILPHGKKSIANFITSSSAIGVSKLVAGDNITLSPTVGTGSVTITAGAGGGGGTVDPSLQYQVPYFRSTSALSGTAAMAYDSASEKLELTSTVVGNASLQLQNTQATSTVSGLEIYDESLQVLQLGHNNNTNESYLWGTGDIPLKFATSGTERMRIAADGNVGIGTATPEYALDVVRHTTSPVFAAKIYNDENTGKALWLKGGLRLEDNGYTKFWDISSDSAANLGLKNTAGTTHFYLLSGGNLGLGTDAPSYKLQVVGTLQTSDNIRAENSSFMGGRENAGAPTYRFHDDGDTGMFNVASNILAFATSGTEQMRILENGNVGIGTSTPASLLHLSGAAADEPAITITSQHGDPNGGQLIFDHASASPYIDDQLGTVSFKGRDTSGSTVEYSRIEGSPYQVVGSGGASGVVEIKNLDVDTDTMDTAIRTFGCNTNIYLGVASKYIQFAGGEVNSYGTSLYMNYQADQQTNISRAALYVQNYSANSSDPRVGIGTTGPAHKLDVVGNAKIRGTTDGEVNLYLGQFTDSATTALYEVSTFDDGGGLLSLGDHLETKSNRWTLYDSHVRAGQGGEVPVSRLASAGSDTSFQLYRATNPTTDATYTTAIKLNVNGDSYLNGGNVGIGTTSPEAFLDVSTGVGSDTVAALKLGSNGSHGWHFYDRSTDGDLRIQREVSTTHSDVMNLDRSTGDVWFYEKVGIGTTSPAQTLDVVGTDVAGTAAKGATIRVGSDVAAASNKGGSIVFGDTGTDRAIIKGSYLGGSSEGQLTFSTAADSGGALTARMTINEDGVGIGTTSPTRELDVVGKMGLNDGNNNILIGDDTGGTNGTGNTAIGFESLSDFTEDTNSYNTAVGMYSMKTLTSGTYNTAMGYYAMGATKADTDNNNNVAIGGFALYHASGTNDNVAIGYGALNDSYMSGNGNVAVGKSAGSKNSSGYGNVYLGYYAGSDGTSANRNVIIGNQAGQVISSARQDVIIGQNAGRYLDTGRFNVMIGDGVGYYTTVGEQNTYLGLSAGAKNVSGSANVCLGYQAGPSSLVDEDNRLYIANAEGTPLIGGNFSADEIYLNGNVGIGTVAPSYALDVYTADASGNPTINISDGVTYLRAYISDAAYVQSDDPLYLWSRGSYAMLRSENASTTIQANTDVIFKPGDSEAVRMLANGNVGIGTTAPTSTLTVSGGLHVTAGNDNANPFITGSTNTPAYTFYGDQDTGMYRAGANTLAFETQGTARITIDPDGDVGIGTGSPAHKLDVAGATQTGDLIVTGSTLAVQKAIKTDVADAAVLSDSYSHYMVPCPTSDAPAPTTITITAPASPVVGDEYFIISQIGDTGGPFSGETGTVRIVANTGQTINGVATNINIDTRISTSPKYRTAHLICVDTNTWAMTISDVGPVA